jgi:predicted dehydrogenase
MSVGSDRFALPTEILAGQKRVTEDEAERPVTPVQPISKRRRCMSEAGTADAPLAIGILGAATVATYAMIAPARETGAAQIVAVAARHADRAVAYAQTHGIPDVVKDYASLIADSRIDAVYNALPPALHAEWSIKALQAGKHVLCEKPFCTSADQARAMVAAAGESGKLLIEAFHYRHHPLFARVLEIVRGGSLGTIRRIAMHFEAPVADTPSEIRYKSDLGGGALLDMGTYCVHICRSIAGEEPVIRSAAMTIGSKGVDTRTQSKFDFPSGIAGEILCDMAGGLKVELRVEGDHGTLVVQNPIAPQFGHLIELNGQHELSDKEATFNFQLRAFVAAVRSGAPQTTASADSIAQMEALDAIREAALVGA